MDAHVPDAPDQENLGRYHLLMVDGGCGPAEVLDLCRRRRTRLEDGFTPILYVADVHGPTAGLACFEGGADTYRLLPFDVEELLAQTRPLLRLRMRAKDETRMGKIRLAG